MLAKSCVMLIESELQKIIGIQELKVRMGEVSLKFAPDIITQIAIERKLTDLGFQPVYDNDAYVAEQIKIAAIELIFLSNNVSSLVRNSDYISDKLQLPYEKLSRIFSKTHHTTLEKYLIVLKVERIKELLQNNAFTLSEISFMMGYSSVQYLSNQFKKVTGITVSEYKHKALLDRVPLEDLLECTAYRKFFNA